MATVYRLIEAIFRRLVTNGLIEAGGTEKLLLCSDEIQ
jgi:hypothetical protein